jgi:hypothetical protein
MKRIPLKTRRDGIFAALRQFICGSAIPREANEEAVLLQDHGHLFQRA